MVEVQEVQFKGPYPLQVVHVESQLTHFPNVEFASILFNLYIQIYK